MVYTTLISLLVLDIQLAEECVVLGLLRPNNVSQVHTSRNGIIPKNIIGMTFPEASRVNDRISEKLC